MHLKVEQQGDRLFLDAVHHGLEHREALALVFDQRIALPVRAKLNAFLQVVHLVQVLAPLAVEHRQHHPALEFAHDRLAVGLDTETFFALLVREVRVSGEFFDEEVGRQTGAVAPTRLFELLDRDAHRVKRLERRPQLVEIPLFGVTLDGRGRDVAANDIVDHVLHLVVQVAAVQHPAALFVDDRALLVHHFVVLQDVLANLEVLLLDLRLSRPDRPAHHLRLDGHVVGDVQGVHDAFDGGPVEQPHKVVAQREIETRLAGVALATRPTTQLVVDTP